MLRVHEFLIVVILAGIVGGVAGFGVLDQAVVPRLQQLESTLRERIDQQATTTKSHVQVVRVEREPAAPVIPSVFLQNRRSSLVSLIKRARSGEDESLLTDDRFVGSLAALTVDGWLATSASLFEGIRVGDVQIIWEGRTYPILKAIKDTSTDIVYVKTGIQDLPVTSFVSSADIVTGLPVWLETEPGRLSPHVIIDVRERFSQLPMSSEKILHRYVINGAFFSAAKGGNVWDARGQLIGMVEGGNAGGIRIIPASGISEILASLTGRQEIRRATFGVAGIETAAMLPGFSDRLVPGYLIRSDRAHGLVAVDPKGPAANLLKEGDIIERIDRDVLDGTVDLGERLSVYQPGTALTVYGQRAGKPFQVSLKLGSVVTSEVLK